jgi:hypothetical protein
MLETSGVASCTAVAWRRTSREGEPAVVLASETENLGSIVMKLAQLASD